jgi:hypothetical protein
VKVIQVGLFTMFCTRNSWCHFLIGTQYWMLTNDDAGIHRHW